MQLITQQEIISQNVRSFLAKLSGKNVTDIVSSSHVATGDPLPFQPQVGKIPTVSPQSVSAITKLLQPLGQCTANGDDIYKLFHKLSELLL